MPTPSFLSNDTWKRAQDLAFRNRVQEDIHELTWPQTVADGLAEITRLGQSIMVPQSKPLDLEPLQAPEPLPIVVSDRPEISTPNPQPTPTTPSAPGQAGTPPASAPSVPGRAGVSPPPAGIAGTQQGGQASPGVASATYGEIDNTSRETFVRTAYPYALQAAKGDAQLAQQLLATAISENGTIGTGKPLGFGFNFGGIQGVPGTAGNVTADDAGRPRSFAQYNTPQEGFDAVANLVTSGRYQEAYDRYRQTGDIDAYWDEVMRAGYAEDQRWAGNVRSIRTQQVAPVTQGLPAQQQAAPQAPVQQAGHYPGDGHNHADDYDVAFGFNQAYSNPFNPSIPRHRGVDLVVRGAQNGGRGTPVRAFQGGTVVAVTQDPNGGNGIIIQDDEGLYHRYFHFDSMNVERGQRIQPGQPIGVLGASGTEGFPHVHFEVSRGINGDPMDQLIDPTPYMRPRRQARAAEPGTTEQPLAMSSGDEGHQMAAPQSSQEQAAPQQQVPPTVAQRWQQRVGAPMTAEDMAQLRQLGVIA